MKKIMYLALIFLLCFNVSYAYESFYEEEPTPEVVDFKVFCNGEEIKLKTVPFKSDYFDMFYHAQSYQYFPIAEALGYTTTYDEATDSVTSVRGERIVKFTINSLDAEITENEIAAPAYIYDYPYVIDGRTYMSSGTLEQLLDIYIDVSEYDFDNKTAIPEVNIYEYEHIEKIISEKFAQYISANENMAGKSLTNTQIELSADLNFDFNSNTFGTQINGNGKLEGNLEFGEAYIYGKLTSSLNGIFNFFKLSRLNYWYYEEESETIDMNAPYDFEFYLTSEYAYLRTANEEIIKAFFGYDYLDLIKDNSNKDKWLKVDLPYDLKGAVNSYLSDEKTDTNNIYVDLIAKNIISNNAELGYDEVITKIEELAAVVNEEILNYNEITKTFTIKCDTENYKLLAEKFGIKDELFDFMLVNIDITEKTDVNGNIKSNGSISYKLQNFTNPYGIDVGTIGVNCELKSVQKSLKSFRNAPAIEDILNFNEEIF